MGRPAEDSIPDEVVFDLEQQREPMAKTNKKAAPVKAVQVMLLDASDAMAQPPKPVFHNPAEADYFTKDSDFPDNLEREPLDGNRQEWPTVQVADLPKRDNDAAEEPLIPPYDDQLGCISISLPTDPLSKPALQP